MNRSHEKNGASVPGKTHTATQIPLLSQEAEGERSPFLEA